MKKGNYKSILFLLFFSFIFAQTFDFYQSFIYDDNVFKFSKKDLDLFIKGKKDKDYKTVDDFITGLGLKLNFYKGISQLSFQIDLKGYLQNRKKSFQNYNLNFKFSQLTFGYSFLPNYYLRNFYQKPCLYTEHSFLVKFNFENFSFGIKNEIDLYNEDFQYYNSNSFSTNWQYEKDFNTNYQIKNNLTLTKNWIIEKAIEKPDISYFQIGDEINFKKRGEFVDLVLTFEIQRRNYLTKIDLTHKNRIDYLYLFGLELPIKFKKELKIILGYSYEKRSCNIPFQQEFEDIKNYQKNIFYLKLIKGGRL